MNQNEWKGAESLAPGADAAPPALNNCTTAVQAGMVFDRGPNTHLQLFWGQ